MKIGKIVFFSSLAIASSLATLSEAQLAGDTKKIVTADRLIAAAERHGRILQVGHLERFNPAVIELEREGSSPALTPVMNYLQNYVKIPGGIFLLCYLAICSWFFVAVISGRTFYQRWMAFVNPFLFSLLIALLHLGNVLPVVVNALWPAWLLVAIQPSSILGLL